MSMKDKFIPKVSSKTTISIRLEGKLVAGIEELMKKQQMSRSEVIEQCIVFSLEHLDENETDPHIP